MKTLLIPIAIAGAALSGCEEYQPTQEEISQESRLLAAKDTLDLQEKLAEMQALDPRIQDAYYGFNANGEKELHIIRSEVDGMMSDVVFPAAAAGLLAGYIFSNGFASSANQYGLRRDQFPPEKEKERKNENGARPMAYIPIAGRSLTQRAKSSVISTKSSAFSSTSSVRAGGYSSGG
ncbi:hypothetical protein P5704_024765 (plasmid) [Pseudomonas sp. FeN3W]|nr:hypothetical protein P5704_024765 [Pseudomonas sp. FeN3W]